MITIKESNKSEGRTIQTNDIPGGTTFRGTVYGSSGPVSGLFVVALPVEEAGWTSLIGSKFECGPLVLCLNKSKTRLGHPTIYGCRLVENYEPVEIELTVKESNYGAAKIL